MTFGKEIRSLMIEEWKEYYITYKRLKRVIHKLSSEQDSDEVVAEGKHVYQPIKNRSPGVVVKETKAQEEDNKGSRNEGEGEFEADSRIRGDLDSQFLALLDQDLEKVSNFLKIHSKKLQEEYAELLALGLGHEDNQGFRGSFQEHSPPAVYTSKSFQKPAKHRSSRSQSASGVSKETEDKALALYTNIVKLQAFRDLNLHGFRKIVKKYDKHTQRMSLQLADRCRETIMTATRIENSDGLGILYKNASNLLTELLNNGSTIIPNSKSSDPEEALRNLKTKILTSNQKHAPIFKPLWTVAALVLCGIVMLIPVFPGEDRAHRCLGLLSLVTVMWVTEALPFFVTSLSIPFFAVIFFIFADDDGNLYSAKDAVSHALSKMFNDTVLLVLGGFTISMAFGQCGFELRMAAMLQERFGSSPRLFLLAFMFLGFFLSMWISNVAAPVLCTAILLPIIADLDPDAVSEGGRTVYPKDKAQTNLSQEWESGPMVGDSKGSNAAALKTADAGGGPAYHYTRALLIGLAMACNIGGMVSPISSPQNAIAIGYLNDNEPGDNISFIQWIGVALPVCIFAVLTSWGVVCLLVLPRGVVIQQVPEIVYKKKPLSLKDKFVLVVSITTILLWCTLTETSSVLGTAGLVALVPMILFFGTGILTKQDLAGFSWNVILLLAGGNVLGNAIDNSDLLSLLSDSIKPTLMGYSVWVSLVLVVCMIFVITSFISHTVGALILMPFIVDIAEDVNAVELLVLCATFAISSAMSLPTSSFPNINSLLCDDDDGNSYLHSQDFLKYGTVAALLTLIVILTLGFGLASAMFPVGT